MTAVKWTKIWCFQQSVSLFQAELMFAFTVVGPIAPQHEFSHHLMWNSSHRAFTSHQIMSQQTQQPQYTRSWIKTNRGGNAAKDNPRTPVTPRGYRGGRNSDKGSSQQLCSASPCLWVLTEGTSPGRSTWIPEATFNSYSYYIYNWNKKLPKAEVSVKRYLVVYPTSSTSVLPGFCISYQNLHPNASTSQGAQVPRSRGWHSGL